MSGEDRLPQRVLLTADAVGGVWDYSLELSRGLCAAGVEVVLAVLGPPPDEAQRACALGIPGLELAELGGRLEWMEAPWQDVDRAGQQLLTLAAGRRVDLVHLNGFCAGALPFEAPTLVVAHSCVLSWWQAVRGEPAPASWDPYRQRVGAGLRGADLVVAPSAAMLRQLLVHHGSLPRTQVIPNGRSDFTAGQAAPAKQPFVLAVGRLWDPAKNVGALCTLAPRLPWPVKVAGSLQASPDTPTAGLEGVAWLGRLARLELERVYRTAAIYALPVRYEPFGLSILEAALAGCALVLGDIPSQRELWDGAALFVPPDDQPALLAALGELIADERRRAGLGAAARQRAAGYSAQIMVTGYLSLYRRLLSFGRSSPRQTQPQSPVPPGPPLRPEERTCVS